MKRIAVVCILLVLSLSLDLTAQKKQVPAETPKDLLTDGLLSNLQFRSLGPAITSGRVSDIAVNPVNPSEYYVAAASAGVWKTSNAGITFTPVFEGEGSYSIGCLAIDPTNPNVIWVAAGKIITSVRSRMAMVFINQKMADKAGKIWVFSSRRT
mgnify:CR=1 FL=1